jgi:hypothetical protein
MSTDKFVPHENVAGPARLDMEKADNSGTVNADPMFMAERLAITNHVLAYSYLIDEGRWEWFALFWDDLVFENSTPGLGTVITKGMKAFEDLVQPVASCSRARGQRRRQIGVPAIPLEHDVRAPPAEGKEQVNCGDLTLKLGG